MATLQHRFKQKKRIYQTKNTGHSNSEKCSNTQAAQTMNTSSITNLSGKLEARKIEGYDIVTQGEF